MDDLIGGLGLLMVGACIVAILIGVALAVIAATAAIGSVIVGGRGAIGFVSPLSRRIQTRGGPDRKPRPPEPAFELYALTQIGRDVRYCAEQAWERMQELREKVDTWAARFMEGPTKPLGIGLIIGGYVGLALGAVLCICLTLPLLLVVGIAIAGAWALIWILRGAEAVRRRIRRSSYECPVDHERFPLPVYVCPGCGAEHKQLVPGRWGIRRRECQCAKIGLPTMVLNGRQKVPQRCPNGHALAGIIGFSEILRVALISGPSAGKTTFLAGTLTELVQLSESGTLALSVVDGSKSDYDQALENLAHGRLPRKTQGTSPALVTEVQGEGRSRILSLYDVAGESFIGDDSVRQLRFLEVPSGLVLLVDPLSLDRFATDHQEEISAVERHLAPSPVSPTRVLETTLGALSETGADSRKIPVAVVVGKADALDVATEIKAMSTGVGDRSVPEWLEQQGGGNFVRIVESSFETVGWFHASALGRIPDPANQQAFVPEGTAAPLLWLLEQNRVTPAKGAFSATRQAEKLSGARAEDFALPGRAA